MTMEDLGDEVRSSFLAGYRRKDRSYALIISGVEPERDLKDEAAEQRAPDAYGDGRRLNDARKMVMSASVSEYDGDVRAFDELAAEINAKYGAIVAASDEPGAFELRYRQ